LREARKDELDSIKLTKKLKENKFSIIIGNRKEKERKKTKDMSLEKKSPSDLRVFGIKNQDEEDDEGRIDISFSKPFSLPVPLSEDFKKLISVPLDPSPTTPSDRPCILVTGGAGKSKVKKRYYYGSNVYTNSQSSIL